MEKYLGHENRTENQIFLWSVCHDALASKANMFQRHIITNPICHLCQQNVPETLEHIFVQCTWTRAIWSSPQINLRNSSLTITQLNSWLTERAKSPQHSPGFALVANILWQIWRMRNNFIFRNQLPDSSLAIQTAIALTSTYQISSATSRQSFGLPSLRSNSTLASSRDGYPQMQYWWKL